MNWILMLSLVLLSFQPVYAEQEYHPVVSQPESKDPRHQPYLIDMRTEALRFLNGSWAYSDKNVRIVESWATNEFGDSVGVRKRTLIVPETKSSSVEYDFFAVIGNQMTMRRMNMNLQNVGTQTGIVGFGSDCTNKVSIDLNENPPTLAPLVTMNYVSPSDSELDLEIITNENGRKSKEVYKLKRTP
jgi:hypothetical protein